MTTPKPDKFGIYPAPTWQLSNPQYDAGPPVESADGRIVVVDAGTMYDAEQLGKWTKRRTRDVQPGN